jgi:hypothetical protein
MDAAAAGPMPVLGSTRPRYNLAQLGPHLNSEPVDLITMDLSMASRR